VVSASQSAHESAPQLPIDRHHRHRVDDLEPADALGLRVAEAGERSAGGALLTSAGAKNFARNLPQAAHVALVD
jgi:hypothetical protein